MAHWKESDIIWKGQRRTLPAGAVVLGIKELADRWGCSQRTISKWLHYLNDSDRIVLESCARGTLVTIRNWEKYQSANERECADRAQGVRTECSPGDNKVGLIEESMQVKHKEKNIVDFQLAFNEFKQIRGVQKGSKAETRFHDQVKSEEDLIRLVTAIRNYRAFLSWPENSWRKPKTTFETFLGSKHSGYFWRDFLECPERTTDTAVPLHMVKPV